MTGKLRETDLYPPLAGYLTAEGYEVHAEVLGADIAARRDERLIFVEMKLSFNLGVVLQAVEKQGAADETYIAVPLSGRKRWPPRWKALKELLGRLGIGVFFVRFSKTQEPRAERVLAAENPGLKNKLRRKKTARREFLREMDGRPGNFNTGGSTQKKLVTAYLVKCIHIAYLLAQNAKKNKAASGLLARRAGLKAGKRNSRRKNPMNSKALRELGGPEDCAAILRNNFHGWFRPEGGGLYTLGPAGEAALVVYAEVVKAISRKK
jgi:hypothetical protein